MRPTVTTRGRLRPGVDIAEARRLLDLIGMACPRRTVGRVAGVDPERRDWIERLNFRSQADLEAWELELSSDSLPARALRRLWQLSLGEGDVFKIEPRPSDRGEATA